MDIATVSLVVSLIFAVIYAWPHWTSQTFAPWRPTAFALSWLFFVLFWVIRQHAIHT